MSAWASLPSTFTLNRPSGRSDVPPYAMRAPSVDDAAQTSRADVVARTRDGPPATAIVRTSVVAPAVVKASERPSGDHLGKPKTSPPTFSRRPVVFPAVPWLETFTDGAERSRRVAPRALALRCRGLRERSIETVEQAVELHREWGNRFQEGRTKLCLGEALRRARRAGDARDVLRGAVEDLDAAGATSWAERAREELAASGARVGQRQRATDELTPQERNVARLVAAGMSNRDIAQQLFLSTNTGESHLRHAFQKLQVTSRTQLALAFAQLG